MAVAEQHRGATLGPSLRTENEAANLVRRGGMAVLRFVLFAVISLIFLVPFIWMIFGSLRRETEIFQYLYPLSWHTFFPIEWTLEHYQDIFGLSAAARRAGLNFGRNLLNSFIVSTGV
ncbi:MAG: hypothetical protein ACRERD_32535, partial [Candidatus Binatia bacterium]